MLCAYFVPPVTFLSTHKCNQNITWTINSLKIANPVSQLGNTQKNWYIINKDAHQLSVLYMTIWLIFMHRSISIYHYTPDANASFCWNQLWVSTVCANAWVTWVTDEGPCLLRCCLCRLLYDGQKVWWSIYALCSLRMS